MAEPEDAIAALCGDPEGILSTLEDEEPYEWLDKKLNNICGSWAVNHGYIPLAIKHGDLGLHCNSSLTISVRACANGWTLMDLC